MMSFKKIIAIGMVAATALTSSAVSMAVAPSATVYAAEEKVTAVYGGDYYGAMLSFTNEIKGKFVTVAQYAKEDSKTPKATYVVEDGYYFNISNFNLKKETYWKVYDETMKPEDVKMVKAPAQSDKVTIKIKDATKDGEKDTILDMLDVKVGKAAATKEQLEQISINGRKLSEMECSEFGETARCGGATFTVAYAASNAGIVSPMSAATKFKVPASAKAPKVTIDYVNGTYKLPNKSEYTILKVDPDTKVITGELVPASAVAVDSKEKQTLTIDKVFEDKEVAASKATQAAIYVQMPANGKKFESQPAILIVDKLDTATMSAGTVAMSGTAVTVKDAKVKVGTTDIAEITKFEGTSKKPVADQVVIKASKDIQYTVDGGAKWVTVKAGKSGKPITVKKGTKISIKQIGVKKDAQFGSLAAEITVQ